MNKFDLSGKQIKTIDSWKKRVFIRDNYTCKDCNLFCPTICTAHHIIERNTNPELKLIISNGITLCPNCHATRHFKQGRKYSGKIITEKQKELIKIFYNKGFSLEKISTEIGVNKKSVEVYIK